MTERYRPFHIAERIKQRVTTEADYIMPTPENIETLQTRITEMFGELPEIEYSEDVQARKAWGQNPNYWNSSSPFFVNYNLTAFNPKLGHAIFEGQNERGDEDHYVEYCLIDSDKKSYARREFNIGNNGKSCSVYVTYADGNYREVYSFHGLEKRSSAKQTVWVEVKQRPPVCDYLDYDGVMMSEVIYYKGKLQARMPLAEATDISDRSASVSFSTRRNGTVKANKYYGYSKKDIGIKKFGQVFNGDDVAPYSFTAMPMGENFVVRRVREMNDKIYSWNLQIPALDPNIQAVMTSESLDWVKTHDILPVDLVQQDQPELVGREKLPSIKEAKERHVFP